MNVTPLNVAGLCLINVYQDLGHTFRIAGPLVLTVLATSTGTF